MRNTRRAGILVMTATAALLAGSPGAWATGDLDCGDPGTHHNMPIDPNNDPHGLDGNHDGIGCEDPSVFEPGPSVPEPSTPPAPQPTEPPAPAPTEPPAPAAPAQPVEREPDYTG